MSKPKQSPRSRGPSIALKRLLLWLEPHGAILVLFAGVWLVLCLRFGVRLEWTDGTIVLPLALLLVLMTGAAFTTGYQKFLARARRLVVDWLPFVGANFVYENLRQFTGVLRERPIDAYLDRADRWLFGGVPPTLWMRHVQTPLLTDWMAFAYDLYFILPMFIVVLLYVRGRRHDFIELSSALVLCLYAGFVLYVIFPAGPPRFYAPFLPLFDPPHLASALGVLEHTQGKWDALNPIKVYASFPSLHCALSTVTLCYALRFDGALLRRGVLVWIIAPLVVSLWIATVYLRHHWVVDVIAGQSLGLVAYFVSRGIRRRFDAWEIALR